ncbi:hypothetical protein K402DRAFT_72794 [Aulographum hederae CBS 113979]|uniref:Uncharacterized protein n=1 Tax=Aulographum hederae CBS 113979 TaxID=1176131 RepID=A0A6G1HFD0_9PEZI|nr:hypothetical protein K402DRAFT_72794 [Aulographum hederae CBS 113979]
MGVLCSLLLIFPFSYSCFLMSLCMSLNLAKYEYPLISIFPQAESITKNIWALYFV